MYSKKNRYGRTNTKITTKILGLEEYDFRSKAEVYHAMWLLDEKKAGRIESFLYEKRYHLDVEGQRICDIIPDFTVHLPNGAIEIHEIKGGTFAMTPEWRIKSKLFKVLYPHLTYRVNPKKIIGGM